MAGQDLGSDFTSGFNAGSNAVSKARELRARVAQQQDANDYRDQQQENYESDREFKSAAAGVDPDDEDSMDDFRSRVAEKHDSDMATAVAHQKLLNAQTDYYRAGKPKASSGQDQTNQLLKEYMPLAGRDLSKLSQSDREAQILRSAALATKIPGSPFPNEADAAGPDQYPWIPGDHTTKPSDDFHQKMAALKQQYDVTQQEAPVSATITVKSHSGQTKTMPNTPENRQMAKSKGYSVR